MTESRTRLRLKVLAWLCAVMFAALTTRLWFLQVLASDQFARMADQNQVRLVPLEPMRGEILDRTGAVIVGNRASTVVLIDRQELPTDQQEAVLYRLAQLLGLPVSEVVSRMKSLKYLPYQPVPVALDVPKEKVFYIEEHRDLFPGVSFGVEPVRSYPDGTLGAQMVGYVGEVTAEQLKQPAFAGRRPGEIVGQAGLEAVYDHWLYGKDGTRAIQVNAQGRVLNDSFGGQSAEPGDNLVLSIDARAQRIAEQSLDLGIKLARNTADPSGYLKATGGAAIVLDPNNGQVVAMASYPSFDPAIFLNGLSNKEFRTLTDPKSNYPLLNRAIQGAYPAGSTFKPFVALASLKEGFATENGSYNCPASYSAPIDPTHHQFHNWEQVDRGFISLPEALVVSCDTVFYQFGYQFWVKYRHTGDELMQQDLGRMGFGQLTGIDLPGEQPGVIPTTAYEQAIYRSNPKVYGKYYGWLPGDSINLAIGQGYLEVTPLQLAAGFGAIANGGTLYQPHLGWKIQSPDGRVVKVIPSKVIGKLPLSRQKVLFIRNALAGVTTSGTASQAFAGFPLDRIPVAGKTGTAEIVPKQPYSWFAAIAPANNPKYVVVVLVEQGGHGATTAAPVARHILEGLFGVGTGAGLQAGAVVD